MRLCSKRWLYAPETRRIRVWLLVMPTWSQTLSCTEGGLMKVLSSKGGANVRIHGGMQRLVVKKLQCGSHWGLWFKPAPARFFFQWDARKGLQEVRILKVPKPVRWVRGGKALSVEDSRQGARNVMSKKEMRRRAGPKNPRLKQSLRWSRVSRTRGGLFQLLGRRTFHWSEVERAYEQVEKVMWLSPLNTKNTKKRTMHAHQRWE